MAHPAQELEGIKAELEDRGIEYPEYYLQVCAPRRIALRTRITASAKAMTGMQRQSSHAVLTHQTLHRSPSTRMRTGTSAGSPRSRSRQRRWQWHCECGKRSRHCSRRPQWTDSAAPSRHAYRSAPGPESPLLQEQNETQSPSRRIHGLLRLPQEFREEHGCPEPAAVLDVGCSAGIGTRRLADAFPSAHVTGLDLSPHFLAVAELREREHERCARAPHEAAQNSKALCSIPDHIMAVVCCTLTA